MSDPFEFTASGLTSPATGHAQIVPSDSADIDPRPRALYCSAAGDVALSDGVTTLTYTMTAGEVLPFRARRVMATGTTATVYGWV